MIRDRNSLALSILCTKALAGEKKNSQTFYWIIAKVLIEGKLHLRLAFLSGFQIMFRDLVRGETPPG